MGLDRHALARPGRFLLDLFRPVRIGGALMAVTGRFVLLVLAGVLPVLLLSVASDAGGWALLGWVLLLVGVGIADLPPAASPRRVALARDLPGRIRLGETAHARLFVTNTGRRTLKAVV